MKRRGFLGMLFGAPAVAVAGKAIADAGDKFPKALIESEPKRAAVVRAMNRGSSWDIAFTSVVSDIKFELYDKTK